MEEKASNTYLRIKKIAEASQFNVLLFRQFRAVERIMNLGARFQSCSFVSMTSDISTILSF